MLKIALPLLAVMSIVALGFSLDAGMRTGTAATSGAIDTSLPSFGEVIEAPGRVEGITEEAELRPELPGRVVEIRVQEGDVVDAGDVLLVLDGTTQRHEEALCAAELKIAEAELERLINGARPQERREAAAQHRALLAQLDAVRKRLDRAMALRSGNHATQQQVDDLTAESFALQHQAEAALARSELLEAPAREDEVRRFQAKVAAARARWEHARAQCEKMVLRATCRGSVLKILAQPGELTSPDMAEPALILADTSTFYVRAFVEEFDAPRIALGMVASVSADGLPGQAFSGRVVRLAPYMSRKELFTDDPAEQYDTKVREVWVELAPATPLIIGLRVDVALRAAASGNRSP